MSHLIAVTSNAPENLCCAVETHRDDLVLPGDGAGGFGLGYYSAGELLQRIEPRESGGPLDAARLLAGLSTSVAILHARQATVGPVRRENTHPFKFQSWLFAHNGTFGGFEEIRKSVVEAMPPFLHRRLRGETDSEHVFLLMLAFLYDAGKINTPDPGTDVIRRALRHAVRTIDELAAPRDHATSPASIVVSDGYSLVALERGVPLGYAFVEGVRDCPLCRVSRGGDRPPAPVDHDELRAVIVRSGPAVPEAAGFHRLDPGTFLAVTKEQRVEFEPF